ncbi:hypothetical protein [Yoonia maricola]|nr:hypothetical protein [Yoonia maricola]
MARKTAILQAAETTQDATKPEENLPIDEQIADAALRSDNPSVKVQHDHIVAEVEPVSEMDALDELAVKNAALAEISEPVQSGLMDNVSAAPCDVAVEEGAMPTDTSDEARDMMSNAPQDLNAASFDVTDGAGVGQQAVADGSFTVPPDIADQLSATESRAIDDISTTQFHCQNEDTVVSAVPETDAPALGTVNASSEVEEPAPDFGPDMTVKAAVGPVADDAWSESELAQLPGAGPGLVWMLGQCGVTTLTQLAERDASVLSNQLGVVGQILDVSQWVSFAQENTVA